MALREELGFPNPIENAAHEALMSLVLTGTLLAKEGDAILRPFKLTAPQFNLIMALAYQSESGHLSQSELGRMLLVNRANVTGLVDRMEKAGWVSRGSDAADRRVNRVHLTAAGRRLLKRSEKAYLAGVERVMGALSAEERLRLCRILERLRGGLTRRNGKG